MDQENRVRAWVFGRVESIDMLRERYKENQINELGGDQYVIVRADFVDNGDYNVIIHVDAEVDAGLEEAESVITKLLSVESVETVQVGKEGHIPWPPHAAHRYIPEREADALPI